MTTNVPHSNAAGSKIRPPRSLRRIVYRIGLGFVGSLCSLFPLLGLFMLPNVPGTAMDRALAGLLLSPLVLFTASFLAITVLSGDRLLFSITPLTPRIYFLRQLGLNWPFHAAVGIGPVVAWLIWRFVPAEEWQGFQWTPLMVTEAVVAYYALLLVPVAFFVHVFRFEGPDRYWLTKRNVRRNRRIGAVLFMLFCVSFYFRHEIIEGLRAAISSALDTGTPGVILVGLFSPGSIVAIQGREPLPEIAGLALVALWAVVLVFEIAVLAKNMRRTRPRFEVADLTTFEDDGPFTKQRITASPIAADRFREFLISTEEAKDSCATYISDLSPERQYLRQLPFIQQPIFGHGIRISTMATIYRYPWLVLLTAFWLLAFIDKSMSSKPVSGIGPLIGMASIYFNLYSGIRWTWPLRISTGLPLRLNRLVWEMWKTRLVYGIVCDVVAAGLFKIGLNAGWSDFIFLFIILQILRASGHIRSWLSVLYGAGRKTGSWLYEMPLLFAPIIWLTGFVYLYPDGEFTVALATFLFAFFWLPYGLVIVWWTNRNTDTSLPRTTSSYRPGVPGNESV